MSTPLWEREVDVLVVGGGAGGMAAALSAHIGGCKVLLAEKTDRIGGSTAISGGAVWAPLNSQSGPAGHPDSFEKVWTYMRNTVGDAAPAEMQKAFLDACGPAIDAFCAQTSGGRAIRKSAGVGFRAVDAIGIGG